MLPFVVLVAVMALVGDFLTVRFLAGRAQAALDQDVFRKSVDADVYLRDVGQELLDSVRFAASITGFPEATAAADRAQIRRILASVLAVRTDLDLLVVVDPEGQALVEVTRREPGLAVSSGHTWGDRALVSDVLRGSVVNGQDKRSGFVFSGGAPYLATVGPVRTTALVGAVVAAKRVDNLVADGAGHVRAIISLYDPSGGLLATSSPTAVPAPPRVGPAHTARRTERVGPIRGPRGCPSGGRACSSSGSSSGAAVVSLYSLLALGGVPIATLGVSEPRAPFFHDVERLRLRMLVILLALITGIVVLGAAVSKWVLAALRRLGQANRRLGLGDLSARAPVESRDEIGELARGFNTMAEELQASYLELEMRVAQRTEELGRLYETTKDLAERRSDLFAAVSHEFRTPLFVITSLAELMLDPSFAPDDHESLRESAETIKSSGEDLLRLVNEILDLAKSERGQVDLNLENLAVTDELAALSGTVNALARRSRLKASIDIPPSLPPVRADPARLRQIVLNLVSNACKYTPQGGELSLSAHAQNNHVEISVSNTGAGIPEEAAPYVFEPFYSIRSTNGAGSGISTGIGLAISKRLVEAQGGEIWFTSEEGKVTRFTFTLQATTSRAARSRRATQKALA